MWATVACPRARLRPDVREGREKKQTQRARRLVVVLVVVVVVVVVVVRRRSRERDPAREGGVQIEREECSGRGSCVA